MGFFGHLVVTRSALPEAAFPAQDVEAVAGQWADGLHVTRVFERLGDDWGPFDAFVDRLAQAVPDGFLSASILDSDGAFVHIAVPHVGIDRCWLNLDGVVSHFVVGPPPFDEDGSLLPDDEIEALSAETERATVEYTARLREVALAGDAAAEACRAWATASGLEPAAVDVVREALESRDLVVEQTFDRLLGTLGVARHSGMPGPTTSSP